MKKVIEFFLFLLLVCLEFQLKLVHGTESIILNGGGGGGGSSSGTVGRLVKKDDRRPLFTTEFGSVSAVDVDDGSGRDNYHLEFITMEPNSLFLPVLLHADMLLFVHTGSGRLSWIDSDKDKVNSIELQQGDLYRLRSGALFYLHSSLEPERSRFRIISMFPSIGDEENELQLKDPLTGAYSSINDLVRGFDSKVLQAAFQVPEEVVEEIKNATDMPAIVHAEIGMKKINLWDESASFINAFLSIRRYNKQAAYENKKKKEPKAFNFLKEKPDVKNRNGWSTVVTHHDLHALEGSHIGSFMVNLTKGSMMGPHWNPKATEVSVVLEGNGMVRIVCPSTLTSKDCNHTRFKVEEGDIFVVPRFHPMAQTAFDNDSLAFMGFSSEIKKNHPQFLAGKASVLQTLDRLILAASFGVSNATIDKLLAAQKQSIILNCTSCAEEEEMLMEKDIGEARQKEEEKKKEEERKREEEERKRQEEEEKRQKEEEKRKKEEEERKREEEERKRQEEEEKRQKEEEERKKREEEEEKRREEEEEEERERQREEEQRRQEEGEKRRKEEEEEKRREQKEEERKKREEEEKKRREEEEEREKRQEVEEKRREEEEEKRWREEERERRQEEERQRQQEEARERAEEMQREEEQRRQQEEMQQEEERHRQEEEARERAEEMQRQEEARERAEEMQREEEQRRQREEERRRQEEEARERAEEMQREEEQRRQREEERHRQEEEARERAEEMQREEEAREREEEQRRQWEEGREKEEWEEAREREEERRRREREGREERGEEETEEEAARREERERVEREREEDEAARRREAGLNMDRRGGTQRVSSHTS